VTTSSRAAAAKLQAAVAEAGRSDSITIHPFSTNSHAKIVVADNGKGGWNALIGSCNWLASDFTSFEVSIRLRTPEWLVISSGNLPGFLGDDPAFGMTLQ
jgi:cardiolipin synthase A/B